MLAIRPSERRRRGLGAVEPYRQHRRTARRSRVCPVDSLGYRNETSYAVNCDRDEQDGGYRRSSLKELLRECRFLAFVGRLDFVPQALRVEPSKPARSPRLTDEKVQVINLHLHFA